ncbi:MAG: NosD domain-containing protein [Candidatus Bathyarchaeia archaeon]
MVRRTVSGITLTLLLTSVLALTFIIQPVGASDTIYIRADGYIDPPTARISTLDNVTYTFTGNINDSVVVERDNLVIDGAGYTLQASGGGIGIDVSGRNNVTIKNTTIQGLYSGIYLDKSSNNNSIAGNNITSNIFGIWFDSSSINSVSGNNITSNDVGIWFNSSSINSVSGNNITSNDVGIWFNSSSNNSVSGNMFFNDGLVVWDSHDNVVEDNLVNGRTLVYLEGVSDYAVGDAGQVILVNCNHIKVENLNLSKATMGVQLWRTSYTTIVGNDITGNSNVGIRFDSSSINSVSGNNITSNDVGIWFNSSSNNSISGNNITENSIGIAFDSSSNDSVYHNDFVNNTLQVYSSLSMNVWDDGYSSGGNYWSDYAGIDLHNGVYQNETGSDWIGDSPYIINQNNTDRYPLMHPFALEMQKYEVAFRDLLDRYDEMYSELVALNSTCRSLQESISNLTITCDLTRANLQGHINSLNSTCVGLSQSLTDLQGQLNGLNSTIQASINGLQEKYNSLSNQVNNLLNLVYVLVGLSVVLIIVTIYIATRNRR